MNEGVKIVPFLEPWMLLIKSRKEALGLWLWCSVVACLLVGRGFPPLGPSVMSIAATFFIAISVYVYNDVVDMKADRNNVFKKDRPLASGIVKKSDALKLVYVSAVIGLVISYLNNFTSFLLNLLYFTVFSLYSYPGIHLKKIFLIKEFVISSGLTIVGLSVNYAILGSFSPMVFIGFLLFSIFAFFAMPTGFDSTDVVADRLQGVRSIASLIPYRRRIQLAIMGMVLVMMITPFIYLRFGYNILLPVSIELTGLVYLGFLVPMMMNLDPSVSTVETSIMMKNRNIIVIFIFIICGCVILGSLNLNNFI